jgi:hypothetical protein
MFRPTRPDRGPSLREAQSSKRAFSKDRPGSGEKSNGNPHPNSAYQDRLYQATPDPKIKQFDDLVFIESWFDSPSLETETAVHPSPGHQSRHGEEFVGAEAYFGPPTPAVEDGLPSLLRRGRDVETRDMGAERLVDRAEKAVNVDDGGWERLL